MLGRRNLLLYASTVIALYAGPIVIAQVPIVVRNADTVKAGDTSVPTRVSMHVIRGTLGISSAVVSNMLSASVDVEALRFAGTAHWWSIGLRACWQRRWLAIYDTEADVALVALKAGWFSGGLTVAAHFGPGRIDEQGERIDALVAGGEMLLIIDESVGGFVLRFERALDHFFFHGGLGVAVAFDV